MTEKVIKTDVKNVFVRRQLETLASKPAEADTALQMAAIFTIRNHPEFSSFKNPDNCPEGFLIDQENKLIVQMVCRTAAGDVKALTAEFLTQPDEEGHSVKWGSREFTSEFPF